jgi:hypothetical protein
VAKHTYLSALSLDGSYGAKPAALTGGTITRSALPEIDGVSPRVSLETAPGGGPAYGVGAYFAFPHNVAAAGSVIIEQR